MNREKERKVDFTNYWNKEITDMGDYLCFFRILGIM